jgi:hypothetical protein
VIEQITYLLVIRRLDDLHTREQNKATPDGPFEPAELDELLRSLDAVRASALAA